MCPTRDVLVTGLHDECKERRLASLAQIFHDRQSRESNLVRRRWLLFGLPSLVWHRVLTHLVGGDRT